MKYQTISLKQFYPAKGAIYYVAIATVIFSLFSGVKISYFRAKAHLVFHWCLYNNKLSYPTLATILDRSKEAIGKKLIQLCN